MPEPEILLTGSEGRLGTRLKAPLLEAGVRKILFFDKARGQDLLDVRAVARACRETNVTVHLAGLSHPGMAAPQAYLWHNLVGTLVLAEEALRAGHRRIVFVSSGSVYGWDAGLLPRDARVEESTPLALGATEPYTASKILAEKVVEVLVAARSSLETVILRLAPIWNAQSPPADRYLGAALSPQIALRAILRATLGPIPASFCIYNVADPWRRGNYSVSRALEDGILSAEDDSAARSSPNFRGSR